MSDWEIKQKVEETMRRLPDEIRFAEPGTSCSIAVQRGKKSPAVRVQIGSSRAGGTVTIGATRLGGIESAMKVAERVAARCGLLLGTGQKKGWPRGKAKETNPLGICGISAQWQSSRGGNPYLHVVGQIMDRDVMRTSSRSVELHGFDGALDMVADKIGVRMTRAERSAAIERLGEIFRTGCGDDGLVKGSKDEQEAGG